MSLVKDWGTAGAVIVVVFSFLNYLRRQEERNDCRFKEQQQAFYTLVGNHLEHSATDRKEAAIIQANALKESSVNQVKAAETMATALRELADNCERKTRQGR